MPFWTYIVHCGDGSFYVGHSDAVDHRWAQHQSGEIVGCYTNSRRPLTLVWQQDFATREEALAAERRIKGWSRAKKQALIAGDWKKIQQLAWGTRNPLPETLR
jgi:putative endonuclease